MRTLQTKGVSRYTLGTLLPLSARCAFWGGGKQAVIVLKIISRM